MLPPRSPMAKQIYNLLWLALPIMKGVVAFFLYRRKLHLRYPLFFSYVVYGAAMSTLLYGVGRFGSYRNYFYIYWTTTALLAILSLCVLYEIFMGMFRQHQGLRDFGSV